MTHSTNQLLGPFAVGFGPKPNPNRIYSVLHESFLDKAFLIKNIFSVINSKMTLVELILLSSAYI